MPEMNENEEDEDSDSSLDEWNYTSNKIYQPIKVQPMNSHADMYYFNNKK